MSQFNIPHGSSSETTATVHRGDVPKSLDSRFLLYILYGNDGRRSYN